MPQVTFGQGMDKAKTGLINIEVQGSSVLGRVLSKSIVPRQRVIVLPLYHGGGYQNILCICK
jgi:hypothetical protein